MFYGHILLVICIFSANCCYNIVLKLYFEVELFQHPKFYDLQENIYTPKHYPNITLSA